MFRRASGVSSARVCVCVSLTFLVRLREELLRGEQWFLLVQDDVPEAGQLGLCTDTKHRGSTRRSSTDASPDPQIGRAHV